MVLFEACGSFFRRQKTRVNSNLATVLGWSVFQYGAGRSEKGYEGLSFEKGKCKAPGPIDTADIKQMQIIRDMLRLLPNGSYH